MQRRAYVPTADEMERLFAIHHTARVRLALALSHYAGLRVFEVAQLTVGDVRYADGRFKQAMHVKGKGDKWRSVPISDKLREFIVVALGNQWHVDDPLVPTCRNEHWNPSSLCRFYRDWYREAGIDSTGNAGRRSFMTGLHRKQVPLKIIKELAGHQSLEWTQKYIDVSDAEMKAAVNSL